MAEYAITEIHELLWKTKEEPERREAILRYVGLLFAELAYYHVPQWEIDEGINRAKVIPSHAYRQIVRAGRATEIALLREAADIPFVAIETRRAIAVVGRLGSDDRVFVGIRGTVFAYDWRINLDLRRVRLSGTAGRRVKAHAGFVREGNRIAPKIDMQLRRLGAREVTVSGHSLGGALAAILSRSLAACDSLLMFGAPRVADANSWGDGRVKSSHTRRPEDFVPRLPPRWLGYADHSGELLPDGTPFVDSSQPFKLGDRREHEIAAYRREVGAAVGARLCCAEELTDDTLLKARSRR